MAGAPPGARVKDDGDVKCQDVVLCESHRIRTAGRIVAPATRGAAGTSRKALAGMCVNQTDRAHDSFDSNDVS